jgi:integrase
VAREIAKRLKVAGRNVKKPLLASHVRRLFELWLYDQSSNLQSVMKLTAVTLCYAGFLRFSDLMMIQWQEIRFLSSHMEIFLEKGKTDQYRSGRWVLIARVGGLYCAVALVEFLLELGLYKSLGPGPLILSTTISPSRQSLRKEQPSYTTVNGWFKEGVRSLGLDPSLYGTHSGRRGGATRAANVDVPDRLFKEHGSWKSERAKDGYVVSRLQARLSVTTKLGLQPGVSLSELEHFEREARLA